MSLQQFILAALKVPFKEKGRSFIGWDCYGLVYCLYLAVYGIHLPEYLDYDSVKEYAALKKMVEVAKAGQGWQEVTDPQEGDIAYYELPGHLCHVGVVVGKRSVLHAEEKVGTFIEDINSQVWVKKLKGFYRYVKH